MKDTATIAKQSRKKQARKDLLQVIFWLAFALVMVAITATAARASDPDWIAMPDAVNGRQIAAVSVGARLWQGNYVRVYHNTAGAPAGAQDAVDYILWSWSNRADVTLDYMGTTSQTQIDGAIVIQWMTHYDMWLERGNFEVRGFTAARYYPATNVMASARLVLQIEDYTSPMRDMRQAIHTALHEMGHALGIPDHSPHQHDVMHYDRGASGGRYALTAFDVGMSRYTPNVCHAELTPHGDVYIPGIVGAGVTLEPVGGLLYIDHEHASGLTCSGSVDDTGATVYDVRGVDAQYENVRLEPAAGGYQIVSFE